MELRIAIRNLNLIVMPKELLCTAVLKDPVTLWEQFKICLDWCRMLALGVERCVLLSYRIARPALLLWFTRFRSAGIHCTHDAPELHSPGSVHRSTGRLRGCGFVEEVLGEYFVDCSGAIWKSIFRAALGRLGSFGETLAKGKVRDPRVPVMHAQSSQAPAGA